MLGYLFWHAKAPSISAADYETQLSAFHASFQQLKPAGFMHSRVYRVPALPWMPATEAVYEDWYILENSAALDVINHAAIHNPHKGSHDSVARMVIGGLGGAYELRSGEIDLIPEHVYWFGKPATVPKDVFQTDMQALKANALFWGKYMVFGQTPSFCLQTAEPVEFPSAYTVNYQPLTRIF